jgi:hypothetical protein
MQNQCLGWAILVIIPCTSISLFEFCTEDDGIPKWQHVESSFPQTGQELLIQQHPIRIGSDPKTI